MDTKKNHAQKNKQEHKHLHKYFVDKKQVLPAAKKNAYLGHRRRSKSEGATVQPHLVRSGESHPPKWALPEMGWMEPWNHGPTSC
jgi:hypothetical protein